MTISVDLLTAQALARVPHQDSPGWSDGSTAGVTRALEALRDGGHLIPEPLVREELEAMSEEELIARSRAHRDALAKAGDPTAMVAATMLRLVLNREQPEAQKLVRTPGFTDTYYLADGADNVLKPANAVVERFIDVYAEDLDLDELTWGPAPARTTSTCAAPSSTATRRDCTAHRQPSSTIEACRSPVNSSPPKPSPANL
jgi:hypothetical protein